MSRVEEEKVRRCAKPDETGFIRYVASPFGAVAPSQSLSLIGSLLCIIIRESPTRSSLANPAMSENHTDDKNIELGFESDPEVGVGKFRKMERENKRALQRCAIKSNKLTLEIAQLLAEVTKDYDKASSSEPPLEQEIARLRAKLQKVRFGRRKRNTNRVANS